MSATAGQKARHREALQRAIEAERWRVIREGQALLKKYNKLIAVQHKRRQRELGL